MKLFNKRSSFLYRLYLFWSPLKCWVHSHQRLISSPKFVIFSLSLSSHLLSISLILSSDSPNTSPVALEIGGFGRPADVNIFQAEFLVNSFRNITLSKIFEMWNSFFALSKNFLGMQRYCARHAHIAFITKRKLQLSFFVHCKKSAPKEYHGLHLAKYYCTRIRIKFSLWYLDPSINHGTYDSYEASVRVYGNNYIYELIADWFYPG